MAAALCFAGPAVARIRCQGSFQVTANGNIATPFCADNYLAQVARSYGTRVSDEAIRQNPILKERVCRFIGHDIRVEDICAGLLPEGGRR